MLPIGGGLRQRADICGERKNAGVVRIHEEAEEETQSIAALLRVDHT
jgi:hypothetical protein